MVPAVPTFCLPYHIRDKCEDIKKIQNIIKALKAAWINIYYLGTSLISISLWMWNENIHMVLIYIIEVIIIITRIATSQCNQSVNTFWHLVNSSKNKNGRALVLCFSRSLNQIQNIHQYIIQFDLLVILINNLRIKF